MVYGISSNVGFQGGINTTTNAAPYMNAPYQYAQQGVPADTVQLSAKKSSGAKKGILAAIGTAVVAAGALLYGVKSGKLTKVENASKWTEKLQNLAYNGGDYLAKGYDACKNSKAGEKVKGWASSAIDWCKGLFKKGETTTQA